MSNTKSVTGYPVIDEILESIAPRGKRESDFDQVFEDLEAPEYPATCDYCGEVGTNESMEHHECERLTGIREEATTSGSKRYLRLELEHALKVNTELVSLLRYLRDTAFAFHVDSRHKPDAFPGCKHVICQRVCQAWNEAVKANEVHS